MNITKNMLTKRIIGGVVCFAVFLVPLREVMYFWRKLLRVAASNNDPALPNLLERILYTGPEHPYQIEIISVCAAVICALAHSIRQRQLNCVGISCAFLACAAIAMILRLSTAFVAKFVLMNGNVMDSQVLSSEAFFVIFLVTECGVIIALGRRLKASYVTLEVDPKFGPKAEACPVVLPCGLDKKDD